MAGANVRLQGNIASFYPKVQKHVTLMFHHGASLDDPSGLLEGEGETSRSAKFTSAADLAAKRAALEAVIALWIASKEPVTNREEHSGHGCGRNMLEGLTRPEATRSFLIS